MDDELTLRGISEEFVACTYCYGDKKYMPVHISHKYPEFKKYGWIDCDQFIFPDIFDMSTPYYRLTEIGISSYNAFKDFSQL